MSSQISKQNVDWLELFNNTNKKCNGHFIIYENTASCMALIENNEKYCNQHKLRYRLEKPENCSICYEETTNIIVPLGCGHWIHRDCIKKSNKHQCPLCRQKLYTEDIIYFMGKNYKKKVDNINPIEINQHESVNNLILLTPIERLEIATRIANTRWWNNTMSETIIPNQISDISNELNLQNQDLNSPLPENIEIPVSQINIENPPQQENNSLLRRFFRFFICH
jgi:hypothetical protein